MTHKQWLDNEYRQWIEALNNSTVDNFKDHPMVQRMLSEDVWFNDTLQMIDNIGRSKKIPPTGACRRMFYYAFKIIIDIKPTSIVEIGGGVGQFFVILKALGYKGGYYIADLPEIQAFQCKYIARASEVLGIKMQLSEKPEPFAFLCSFYAIGEFDDETKAEYLPLIKQAPHGLILWNPHSGASEEIPFECTVKDEDPQTGTNIKELSW